MNFLTKIFGTKHDREIKRMMPILDQIDEIYGGDEDDESFDNAQLTSLYAEELEYINNFRENVSRSRELLEKSRNEESEIIANFQTEHQGELDALGKQLKELEEKEKELSKKEDTAEHVTVQNDLSKEISKTKPNDKDESKTRELLKEIKAEEEEIISKFSEILIILRKQLTEFKKRELKVINTFIEEAVRQTASQDESLKKFSDIGLMYKSIEFKERIRKATSTVRAKIRFLEKKLFEETGEMPESSYDKENILDKSLVISKLKNRLAELYDRQNKLLDSYLKESSKITDTEEQKHALVDNYQKIYQLTDRLADLKKEQILIIMEYLTESIKERETSETELVETYDNLSFEELRKLLDESKKEELAITSDVLNELLPEAFAVMCETCRRFKKNKKQWRILKGGATINWDMNYFKVQLLGGIVLHEGKIAEMATGEGKTFVATLALYLNALTGKGVHLVTVNDYLAQRDCEWMGEIYKFLGLRAAFIKNDMNPAERREAYNADITYGTNNEFGFDYLRDNMAVRPEDQVQRGHYFAIVDEVDSVLVDEARTPLIISGPVEQSVDQYDAMKPRVDKLVNTQTQLVNRLMSEAEKLLQNEKTEYEAGVKLLQVQRGAPKNKRFMKLLQEAGTKKLIHRVESDYLRDKKMHELDEDLYFAIDEKAHTIDTTEKGRDYLSPNEPEMFVLPDLGEKMHALNTDETLSIDEKEKRKAELTKEYAEKSDRVHSISQLLRAYSLYEKDVEYVVNEGKVLIVDEFTGRLMPGRRYSDGLHQALEAKEGVRVEGETQTLATITLQNYFRMYHKLAGMTGTAETEAGEFWEIYKLDVTVIPTNQPIRRQDDEDQIYRTRREKYNAVIEDIAKLHEKKHPVLVGTISVEVSETLSRMLKRKGIPHKVLNAKYHQQEAEIVSLAGQPGAVTIATNMAGRGTDIKLGKGVVLAPENHQCALKYHENDSKPVCPHLDEYKCREAVPCGLHIIGTERHEARRIDRQLRGRSGRQGDPGSSRFYLSLEDDLMRLFGSERIASVMDRLGAEEGEVIIHGMVTRSIERAQKRVEGHNFSIRKHLLEYDDVMNKQRTVIYNQRAQALRGENLRDEVLQMIDNYIAGKVGLYCGSPHADEWDWDGLQNFFQRIFLAALPEGLRTRSELTATEVQETLSQQARAAYEHKETFVSPKIMRQIERLATLRAIDEKWREHLYEMDQLKEGINLRAYGQKDPLLEYKSEGFRMFEEMLGQVDEQIIETVFKTQVVEPPPVRRRMPQQLATVHQSSAGMGFQGASAAPTAPPAGKRQPIVVDEKVGRNDPCPCGSGKKYKKCHGVEA